MNCVYLHGILAEKYGPTHRYHVASAREAIRALIANKPKFAEDLRDMEVRVVRSKPGVEHGIDLDETELELGMHGGELHVIPMPAGSKNGGVAKIILGVALIAAVIVTGGGAAAFGAGLAKGGIMAGANAAWVAGAGSTFLGLSGGTVMLAGAAMALGGAAMMLAPSPKQSDGAAQKASFLFNNIGNVTEQGNPVPLVYGLTLTGSVVIALGIASEQIGVTTEYNGSSGYGTDFGGMFSGGLVGSFDDSAYSFGGSWVTVDNYGGGGGGGPSIFSRTDLVLITES